MAFDSQTRNKLQRMVGACRRLLTDEFDDQLQGLYGIYAQNGRVLELEKLTNLDDDDYQIATMLRDRVKHLSSGMASEKQSLAESVRRVLREQAFTLLNRFAALRMAEERGFVQECVGQGLKSKGFQVFETVARSGLGGAYERYVTFIHGMFDEMSLDLGVLFDRWSPFGLLFPREPALLKFFDLLNDPELKPLWKEDETIGWIYQYFNDETERKKMREESSAPRNSRELAVRNQFFTPRYVVEFLTDNTLGRIWYEMTRGETKLKGQCRYLVRRPNEVFLGDPKQAYDRIFGKPEDGEYSFSAAAQAAYQGDLSKLSDDSGPDSRLISLVIPPDQFQTITGQPYQPMEDDRIGRLIHAIVLGESNPDTDNLLVLWAALSRFTLNDGGGAYSIESWRKLWAQFVSVARRPASEGKSQEDLLKQPVFIPHRPIKDPRAILMLDPACGSMHFGLYAFDLFEVIYEEAWELEKRGVEFQIRPAGMLSLRETYGTKEDFLKDVPRLIIEHNLHGIDIDPRCAQIAGLSLWLRAQKAWQRLGLKPAERPAIKRSNIVCAEPMPGEKELLREFVEREFPVEERGVCLRLLEAIFDKMQLAGEAGSLLKIEEEIRSAIEDARRQWQTARQRPEFFDAGQLATLDKRAGAQQELPAAERASMAADLRSLTSEDFWERVEERIYAALRDYAEQAENGGGFQRRLFAEDAARGFAFIDVCRKRYDVALMNPPFGEAALATRPYIAASFPESKDDIYAAFVSRFAKKAAGGILGVISNRTGFFLTGMLRWRESTLLSSPALALMADLGDGVLDGALVEAAAYTISESPASCAFFRLLDQDDKARPLLDSISGAAEGRVGRSTFISSLAAFRDFPESRISYWSPQSVREIYRTCKAATGSGLEVKFGLSTKDDFRFLRLCWEVTASGIVSAQDEATSLRRWMFIAKGGEYSLHFTDIHLVANWANRGHEIGARVVQLYPYLNGDANWVLHTEVPYGKPGVTYTKRTTSGFSPRFLPSGCLISDLGCTVFADDDTKLPRVLATYASRAFGYMLEFNVASGDSVHSGSAARHYEIGTVASVPIPPISRVSAKAGDDTIAIWKRKAAAEARDETSRYFQLPCPLSVVGSWRACAAAIRAGDLVNFAEILAEAAEAEDAIRCIYNFDAAAREACDAEFGPDVTSYPRNLNEADRAAFPQLWSAGMSEVVASTSQTLGFARFISKMTFIADRRLELLCHRFHAHPLTIVETVRDLPATEEEAGELARTSVSFALGCAIGRWDIRYATGEQAAPELPDPFAPLPVCPPGQLQNAQGLPARPEDVPAAYPVRIPWDGILVDDPNHPLDIERRVREVIEIIWAGKSTPHPGPLPGRGEEGGATAEAIEHEACEILGVKSLRDYFRKPAGFFADHLKRYSKSRRQAPIYWPLSTASGSYTLWIYYHHLTDQTLFQCVNDFVKPKLEEVNRDIERLRGELQRADGGNSKQREKLQELEDFTNELKEFHDELLRVAGLPYKPNLNDGVLITASPLWKLFRLPKWQKDLKVCWEALEGEKYEWAHLAYTIWPDRVKKVCKTDRSIAIAHGLEELCEVKAPEKKAKKIKKSNIGDEQQEFNRE